MSVIGATLQEINLFIEDFQKEETIAGRFQVNDKITKLFKQIFDRSDWASEIDAIYETMDRWTFAQSQLVGVLNEMSMNILANSTA